MALPFCCGGTDCSSDLWLSAAPVVEDLSESTHRDVRLGLLECLRVRYAEKPHGCRPFSDFSAATLPAHATAIGKALLAFSLPPRTVEHVIRHELGRYTSVTITTPAQLRHVLKVTKLSGMAVARAELLPEHSAVAVPVFGSVSSSPRSRCGHAMRPGEPAWVRPALTIAARALSRDLRRPASPPAAAQPALQVGRHNRSSTLPGLTEPVPETAVRITDGRHRREQPAVARDPFIETK